MSLDVPLRQETPKPSPLAMEKIEALAKQLEKASKE